MADNATRAPELLIAATLSGKSVTLSGDVQGSTTVASDGSVALETKLSQSYVSSDDLSALQASVTSNTTAITALQTDLTALQASVSSNTTAITGLQTDLTALTNTVTDLGSSISSIQTALTEIQEALDGYMPISGGQFTGGYFGTTIDLEDGSEVDLKRGSIFTKAVTEDVTFTFANTVGAACFTLILTNGGDYTVTWPGNVKWSEGEIPTLTSGGVDVISFISPDGGETWYGALNNSNVG